MICPDRDVVCADPQVRIVECRAGRSASPPGGQAAARLPFGAAPWQGRRMGEIVNLNRTRKQRDREAATRQAAENRVVHGRTGAERLALKQAAGRRAALLDGARLEADAPEGAGFAAPGDGTGS